MPTLPRLLSGGLFLCLLGACLPVSSADQAPAQSPVPAVTAPSPLSMEHSQLSLCRGAIVQLAALGFDQQQAARLWTRLGPQLPQQLEQGLWSQQQLTYLALPNGSLQTLERCLDYARDYPDLTPAQVVLTVNLGLDRPFYQGWDVIAQPSDPLVLVNKYHALPDDYSPELVELDSRSGSGSLTPQAAQAVIQMADAARADGISLRSVSAYRSYDSQAGVYQRNVQQYGTALTDTFSARPGHSEHQTGLALDINVARTTAHFERTAEYAWLQAHCAQFGFLLRYPQDKQEITGYRFEPWHYRYVGVETAQACTQQGLTFDEYLALQEVPGSYSLPEGALP